MADNTSSSKKLRKRVKDKILDLIHESEPKQPPNTLLFRALAILSLPFALFALYLAWSTPPHTTLPDRPAAAEINQLLRTPYEIRWFIDNDLPNILSSYHDIGRDDSLPRDLDKNARHLSILFEEAVDEHHAILIEQHCDVKGLRDKVDRECPQQWYLYPLYYLFCNVTTLAAHAYDLSQKHTPRIEQQDSRLKKITAVIETMQIIINQMKRRGLRHGKIEETEHSLTTWWPRFISRPANAAEMERHQQRMMQRAGFEVAGFGFDMFCVEWGWQGLLKRMAAMSRTGSDGDGGLPDPRAMRSFYEDLSEHLDWLKDGKEDWYAQAKIVADEYHHRYRARIELS